MIGLAKEHEIIKRRRKIEKISFDCLFRGRQLDVQGKKKS